MQRLGVAVPEVEPLDVDDRVGGGDRVGPDALVVRPHARGVLAGTGTGWVDRGHARVLSRRRRITNTTAYRPPTTDTRVAMPAAATWRNSALFSEIHE